MTGLHEGRSDRFGTAMTWLCGGALALDLLLVFGLLGLLAVNGFGTFWQRPLDALVLRDGSRWLVETLESEPIPLAPAAVDGAPALRWRVKSANRDVTGSDYRWIDQSEISGRDRPRDAVLFERLEWGNFHGFVRRLEREDATIAEGETAWPALLRLVTEKAEARDHIDALERGDLAERNLELERLRLERRRIELSSTPEPARSRRLAEIEREADRAEAEHDALTARLAEERARFEAERVVVETAAGETRTIPVGQIVRATRPNELGLAGRVALYASRAWEFVAGSPRESNTEGGIFPAIFGTVLMVVLMSLVVTPFGIVAALYLREYAKDGPLVRLVRIAVNNLAGVPSIVFGVFGLGLFVYGIGGAIDRVFFAESLPTPTFGTGGILWASLTLALLTVPVVIVSTEEGLAAVPRSMREGSLALGATKLETLLRVVIPAAAPGILTGLILALARAAGEVAPLMIVGMVKLAPALPLDGTFPFLHPERKFMHLGFHIYDVGFQSPNVEAAKPLVFATALLLIAVVLSTNLTAILIRNRLRRKYAPRSI